MHRLRISIGAALFVVLMGCTPLEQALWLRWHAVDPFTAEQYTEDTGHPPAILAALEAQVAQLEALPRCALYDRWLDAAGLPSHFHAVMRRETGGTCNPAAYNRSSGASGLLQILRSWAGACGTTATGLFDPATNIRCGVYIYGRQGADAWSTW